MKSKLGMFEDNSFAGGTNLAMNLAAKYVMCGYRLCRKSQREQFALLSGFCFGSVMLAQNGLGHLAII